MSDPKPILLTFEKQPDKPSPDFMFWCPGCKRGHAVWTTSANEQAARWTFNGNTERPTFAPSILFPNRPRCHSFVTDGQIQFLGDCDHELAGKTVPLPPVEI